MTDLAARLRDVLSDETLISCHQLAEASYQAGRDLGRGDAEVNLAYWQAWRDGLAAAVSSLLEEREREIREALTYFQNATEAQIACPFCTAEVDEQHGDSCPARRADELLSRLASSSSPAAPQEQK